MIQSLSVGEEEEMGRDFATGSSLHQSFLFEIKETLHQSNFKTIIHWHGCLNGALDLETEKIQLKDNFSTFRRRSKQQQFKGGAC